MSRSCVVAEAAKQNKAPYSLSRLKIEVPSIGSTRLKKKGIERVAAARVERQSYCEKFVVESALRKPSHKVVTTCCPFGTDRLTSGRYVGLEEAGWQSIQELVSHEHFSGQPAL